MALIVYISLFTLSLVCPQVPITIALSLYLSLLYGLLRSMCVCVVSAFVCKICALVQKMCAALVQDIRVAIIISVFLDGGEHFYRNKIKLFKCFITHLRESLKKNIFLLK